MKEIDSPAIKKLLSVRPFYEIIQINGERVYGPPTDGSMVKPTDGSEIYIFRIPNDCAEDELVPFLEMVGPIYQLRLKVNFSGGGRGYAYVNYSDPFTAQKALRFLKKMMIRPNYLLKMDLSFDNKRLRIEGLPGEAFNQLLAHINTGLERYDYDPIIEAATLKYDSHYSASMARRVMASLRKIRRRPIKFNWIKAEELMERITGIWIRNLRFDSSLLENNRLFTFGDIMVESIDFVGDFVLIRYATRKEAEIAFKLLMDLSQSYNFQICWAFD